MLQSTHYSLKLVEGSDTVNPLVIDRPNYETIDDVMYANESASIGTATELKSGTIHALTRTKGNTNVFRFTATSNYDIGDTFTVDSVPVTALLPNGTAIPDKGYVVNSTVLCCLVGTLLTVFTSGSALADDSLKLGGELPSYYAKQSDMTSVQTLANATSLLAQQNEQNIVSINSSLNDIVKIANVYTNQYYFNGGYNLAELLPDNAPTEYTPLGVLSCGVYLSGSDTSITSFIFENGKLKIAFNSSASGIGIISGKILYIRSNLVS